MDSLEGPDVINLELIFERIESLLRELKVFDWKASIVERSKVVVEKIQVMRATSEAFDRLPNFKKALSGDNCPLEETLTGLRGNSVKAASISVGSFAANRRRCLSNRVDDPSVARVKRPRCVESRSTRVVKYARGDDRGPKRSRGTPNRSRRTRVNRSGVAASKKSRRFDCALCSSSFSKIQNLKIHTEIVHEGKRHSCPKCEKTFTRKDVLKNHVLAFHVGKRFPCEECGKEFTFLGALKYHRKVIHEGVKVAERRKAGEESKGAGVKAERPRVSFDCKTCDLSFDEAEGLKRHTALSHRLDGSAGKKNGRSAETDSRPGGSKHACLLCDRSFSRSTYLRAHVEAVHEGVRYDCDFCPRRFGRAQTLKNHIKVEHKGQRFDCETCGKTFTQAASLKKHVDTLHLGKRAKCPDCNKEFTEIGSLRVHRASVHEGRRFKCPSCDKEFTDPSHVRLHVKSVHEGRRFRCGHCIKSFAHATTLKKHERTHVNAGKCGVVCDEEEPRETTEAPVKRDRHLPEAVAKSPEGQAPAQELQHLANRDPKSGNPQHHHQYPVTAAAAAATFQQQAEYLNNVIFHIVAASQQNPGEVKDSRGIVGVDDDAVSEVGVGSCEAGSRWKGKTDLDPFHDWSSVRLTSLESPTSYSRGLSPIPTPSSFATSRLDSPLSQIPTPEPLDDPLHHHPRLDPASPLHQPPLETSRASPGHDGRSILARVDSPLINQNQFATPSTTNAVFPEASKAVVEGPLEGMPAIETALEANFAPISPSTDSSRPFTLIPPNC